MPIEVSHVVVAPEVTLEVGRSGAGVEPVMLVHGFPHTRRLWEPLARQLPPSWTTLMPDLRGFGGSTRAPAGYDGLTLASDLLALLDGTSTGRVNLVAIDAGVVPAFLLALQHPERVRRLVVMEATLGSLPGAEALTDGGPPWWFGFHQVPGLAETVLEGHEEDYLDFFYRTGTTAGAIDAGVREAFISSYRGRESLRSAFAYYRALAETDRQLHEATSSRRLEVPALAVGSQPVGPLLHQQLSRSGDDVRGELVEQCGHIIPLDRPEQLAQLLTRFIG